MPKLWEGTIDAHREAVRAATLDAVAALVVAHGTAAVTMSEIAKRAGIGRATLYKYFPDLDSVLSAWHERQVGRHLEELRAIRHGSGEVTDRLRAVLKAYALIAQRRHGGELAVLHQGDHVEHAHQQLVGFIRDLLGEGARNGALRDDIAPEELAVYCLHALGAAAELRSKAAVDRLVDLTLDGLRAAQREPA